MITIAAYWEGHNGRFGACSLLIAAPEDAPGLQDQAPRDGEWQWWAESCWEPTDTRSGMADSAAAARYAAEASAALMMAELCEA